MRRTVRDVTLSLALVSGLLVGVGIAAHAQTATGVGAEIPFVDPAGVTVGTVRIEELHDPFTAADPARPAPDGKRYVGLFFAFTAAADQTFTTNPTYVVLRDTDGYTYTPSYVARPAGDAVPDLQAQALGPGNHISGFIGYTVPTDALIDEVLYVDTSSRAVPLADLVATAGPASGTEVDYQAVDGSLGRFTIKVADPFPDFDPAYPAKDGSRYVGLEVVATDPGTVPFQVTPAHIYLRDAAGNLYYTTTIYRPAGTLLPVLEGQPLAPGNLISGFQGYTVPANAAIVAVDMWPNSGRRVTLADLVGGGPAPTVAPASSPAPVTSPAPVATAAPTSAPPASLAPAPSPTPAQSAGTSQ